MNKIFLSGNLTRDVETKSSNGTTNVTFARTGIAVNRRFSKNKEVDFFNLVAFGKTAEVLGKWFSKGSRILIEGQLRTSNYEDKNGDKRTSTEVVIDQLEFADSKKKAANNDLDGEPVPDEDTPF